MECPKLTSAQKQKLGQMHANVATVKESEEEGDNIEGVSFFETERKAKRATLNPNHVYLDSCSTFNQFFNGDHLTNIRESDKLL